MLSWCRVSIPSLRMKVRGKVWQSCRVWVGPYVNDTHRRMGLFLPWAFWVESTRQIKHAITHARTPVVSGQLNTLWHMACTRHRWHMAKAFLIVNRRSGPTWGEISVRTGKVRTCKSGTRRSSSDHQAIRFSGWGWFSASMFKVKRSLDATEPHSYIWLLRLG